MKTYNSIILTAIFSLFFIFSSCESEESDSENLQNQQENNLIGDWTISNPSLGFSNSGYQTVYRFKDDGTVLIGEFVSTQNHVYIPNINHTKALKFYYISNWSIDNGILNIQGNVFSMPTISSEGIELNSLKLKDAIRFPKSNAPSGNYPIFEKKDDISYENEKIMDLSQINFNSASLSGIWVRTGRWWEGNYSSDVAIELNNGRAIKYFNSPNDVLIDVTDANDLASQLRYTPLNPEFPGQILGLEVRRTSISPFGNLVSNTYKIVDFGIDDSGKINYIGLGSNDVEVSRPLYKLE